MKKKVLFLGRFAPPLHGASKMNELYFNALKKDKNFDVQKIKLNKYDSLEDIGKFSKKKICGYIQAIKEFKEKLKSFNPDEVYLEMAPKGVAFFKDSIFVNIAKKKRKKVSIQFHAKGAKETTKNLLAKKYYQNVFKNIKIILLSKILFEDVRNVSNWNQIEILPNGVPDEISEKEFEKIVKDRKENKKHNLLFLSNMIESKGPLDVLKICNKLNLNNIEFECNFVGKFQDDKFRIEFEKQLRNFNLEKKCFYLGPKYNKEKNKILEKTNLLIFPTQEDTFGIVILEAFMYGIPAFSYDEGSISEIIKEDYLGAISQKGDWEDLYKKILKKIESKRFNSKKIRAYFKNNFEIKGSLRKIKEILK